MTRRYRAHPSSRLNPHQRDRSWSDMIVEASRRGECLGHNGQDDEPDTTLPDPTTSPDPSVMPPEQG